jgi:hypothetical protein
MTGSEPFATLIPGHRVQFTGVPEGRSHRV